MTPAPNQPLNLDRSCCVPPFGRRFARHLPLRCPKLESLGQETSIAAPGKVASGAVRELGKKVRARHSSEPDDVLAVLESVRGEKHGHHIVRFARVTRPN